LNSFSISTFGTLFIILILIISLGISSIPSAAASQLKSSNSTATSLPEKRLPAPVNITLEATPQPQPLTEDQRLRLERELQEVDRVPDIPTSNKTILGPNNASSIGANITQLNGTKLASTTSNIKEASTRANVSDKLPLRIVANRTLTPLVVNSVLESSLANKNNTIFYTGNWMTARSIDGGSTWGYTALSNIWPEACCDQRVVYEPNHKMFIWYMQGTENPASGENRLRIGVSSDTFDWRFYTFKPTDINSTWTNQNSDYPYLALSSKYLYISMNMFEHKPFSEPAFIRPLILRISLDDLIKPGVGPIYDYYYDPSLPNTSHTFTLVNGAKDTMYWGIHVSNILMKLYEWSDSLPSTSIRTFVREVPAWTPLNRGEGVCAGPDQNNWCGRGMSKIRGAFMANDIIGFLWDANRGGQSTHNATFTYPYIDAATFSLNNNMSYVGRPYLWSPTFAWMYGYASPDKNGNVAVQAFFGGGKYYPSIAGGVASNFSGKSLPWKMMPLMYGTNGPGFTSLSRPAWGDYITVAPYNGQGPGWLGSGWTLQGGSQSQNVQPRYFEFVLNNANSTSVITNSTEKK
jgi:hypothetical protein